MTTHRDATSSPNGNTLHNGYNSDPMAITWAVQYQEFIQKSWDRLPNWIGTALATLSVFIVGSTFRGEWLIILVHLLKAFKSNETRSVLEVPGNANDESYLLFGVDLQPYHLQNWPKYLFIASTISYLIYFGVGGFLHWYYYIRRRDRAEEWKCQPNKWLSPELERHEIAIGTFTLTLGSIVSSLLACYVMNGGWCKIYYDVSDHGWLWYFASWPVLFVLQDYVTYWVHRFYHYPFLYKHFHKLHHKYKQPTAFSVTAIHPIECLHMQSLLICPMFLFPIHYTVFCTILMYLYYHGIVDHSGINFKAHWWQPWQPDCIFHDNHHQYFHVNFGFNCELWDKIHGTYRHKNKVYTEETYFGKGKNIEACSEKELQADLEERESENVNAYRGNVRDEQVAVVKKRLKNNNK